MSDWTEDEELTKESKFVRFTEGLNEYTFADDGTKVRNFGKPMVEFKTKDERLLSIRPGPMLSAISDAKKKLGTLVGHKISFTRSGTTKEDTRYTDIKVV